MTQHPYCLLELYNIAHGGIYIHIHMYINQHHQNIYHIMYKSYAKTPYQNCFASTSKQRRIHGLHPICHLPFSFFRPKVLPLHFNFLYGSILDHEMLPLQYALRLWLEFSIWFHLQYKPVNHMINIFNILLK